MQAGTIHRLVALFHNAFHHLEAEVPLVTLENLAVMVHKAMTVQTRNFHNLEHVFNFVDPGDPIQTLAALFHDIVYYQLDPGFLSEIRHIVTPYIQEQSEKIYLVESIPTDDRMAWMTLEVFGLQCGELLSPANGLNEFLSALVMNKSLVGIVAEKDLLTMTLCVEATIPFRGITENGETHFDLLARRLRKIGERWQIPLTDREIEAAVQLAVVFANKDVENFAESDPNRFLDNTWKLLPEMNAALRSRDVYTIGEYRRAIEGMEAFLSQLNPKRVFHQYAGVPGDAEYEQMSQRARRNIETASEYLRVKLLTQAILEALAEMTGGDAPLSLFMGDLPQAGEYPQRMEGFLPRVDSPAWVDSSSTVYKLLDAGCQGVSSFDLRTAPLSFFLYKAMQPQEFQRALAVARQMFAGETSAQEFLDVLSPFILRSIARACAEIVFTRREQLLQYAS